MCFCYSVTPNTGQWGSWGSCSKSCGGGERIRSRQCGLRECESQAEPCNVQDCNPEPELRGIYLFQIDIDFCTDDIARSHNDCLLSL